MLALLMTFGPLLRPASWPINPYYCTQLAGEQMDNLTTWKKGLITENLICGMNLSGLKAE